MKELFDVISDAYVKYCGQQSCRVRDMGTVANVCGMIVVTPRASAVVRKVAVELSTLFPKCAVDCTDWSISISNRANRSLVFHEFRISSNCPLGTELTLRRKRIGFQRLYYVETPDRCWHLLPRGIVSKLSIFKRQRFVTVSEPYSDYSNYYVIVRMCDCYE